MSDRRRLDSVAPYFKEPWADCRFGQPGHGNNHSPHTTRPQVTHPGYGLTTVELVEAQQRFTEYARERIAGAGEREYSRGSVQAFEDMSVDRLISELRDEIADSLNYLAFMDVQLSRWQQKLSKVIGAE